MSERYDLFNKYGRRIGTLERKLTPFEQGQRVGGAIGGTLFLLTLVASLVAERKPASLKLSTFAMSPTTTAVCYYREGPFESHVAIFRQDGATVELSTGKSGVYAVAVSRDGHYVATGGKDNHVRLFDAQRGVELWHQKVHWNWFVDAVAFSPDSRRLYFGVGNNDVRVWDLDARQESNRINCGVANVISLNVSPRGDMLAIGGGRAIELYDTQSLRMKGRLTGHAVPLIGNRTGARQVVFSPAGDLLASAGSDKTVRMWSVDRQEQVHLCEGHSKGVWSVAFSADGARLVSGSDDGTVVIWDVSGGRSIRTLTKLDESVRSVAFSGNQIVYAAGHNGTVVELPVT